MNEIYVDSYGAVGDGVTDDRAAIQSAIDFAIANKKTVKFGPKNYKIAGPLILYSLNAGNYAFFNIELEGVFNANAGVSTKCTQITCTHTDTFAIGIQTARSCTIKNILIKGAYTVPENKTYKEIAEHTNSQWAQSGVRDSQYSPYAGIAVDPFGTSVPADGGYPGLSTYYKASAGGSSGISVRDCTISNFVVGYSISNNGTTPNAESINIYNTRIYYTKVAWSSGQSQTRSCAFADCAVFKCQSVIDTVTYGAGIGSPPVFENTIVSTARQVVNIYINRAVFSASSIYCEAIWKVGLVTGDKSASFIDCSFKMDYGNSSEYVLAPDTVIGGAGKCIFDACDFTKSGDQNFNLAFSNITASFYGCNFESKNPPYTNAIGKLKFYDCTFGGVTCASDNRNVGATPSGNFSYHGLRLKKNGTSVTSSIIHSIHAEELSVNSIGSVSVTTGINCTATFTPASVANIKVGDMVCAQGASFYFDDYTNNNSSTLYANSAPFLGTVSSIDAGVVTIKDVPHKLTNGTFTLINAWCNTYFGGIFGTTTSGSNVITNVYKEGGSSLVGQRIRGADPSQFTGLYVVSEDTNARTLTMSGNLNSSKASVGLYTSYFDYELTTTVIPSSVTGLYVDKGSIIKTRGLDQGKVYICTTGGIVGNATHTPVFSELT